MYMRSITRHAHTTSFCGLFYQSRDINPFSAGTDFIRQNLTYKVGPHTERIEIFILAVDP